MEHSDVNVRFIRKLVEFIH